MSKQAFTHNKDFARQSGADYSLSLSPHGRVAGCAFLRFVSVTILLVSIAGICAGAITFNGAAQEFSSSDLTLVASAAGRAWTCAFVIIVSFLSFLPAAFGLSQASQPTASVATLVFGVVGVLIIPFAAVSAGIFASALGFTVFFALSIFMLLALLYLASAVCVWRAVRKQRVSLGIPSKKEELWDDKNIWS